MTGYESCRVVSIVVSLGAGTARAQRDVFPSSHLVIAAVHSHCCCVPGDGLRPRESCGWTCPAGWQRWGWGIPCCSLRPPQHAEPEHSIAKQEHFPGTSHHHKQAVGPAREG